MLSSSRIPLTMPVDSEYKACDFPYKRRQGAGVRVVPSGMGLPDVWTEEMDRVICYCEAVGELPLKTVIASLKKKFPQLDKVGSSFTGSFIIVPRASRLIAFRPFGSLSFIY